MVPPKAAGAEGKTGTSLQQSSTSSTSLRSPGMTGSLQGGSITPGSGEYSHDRIKGSKDKGHNEPHGDHTSTHPTKAGNWLRFWRSGVSEHAEAVESQKDNHQDAKYSLKDNTVKSGLTGRKSPGKDTEHKGLWVTLTPTDMSTSPFFDTLLVLVVSPLVTLTIVYALLLLRSRIRRRRWRAPKSVVDRLPVRTYHTISTSSSTTSSQIDTPDATSPNSPLLRSTPRSVSRNRPRSQTTTGVITSTSLGSTASSPPIGTPTEKPKPKTPKRKRYTSTLGECVVCLEEYIDGESRVMRLPCGHEFHADCVVPWLTNRRRVCPICKLVCFLGPSIFNICP